MTQCKAVKSRHARAQAARAGIVAVASLVVAGALPALADNGSEPTVEDLVKKLEDRDRALAERDSVIRDLIRRVDDLERKTSAPATAAPGVDGSARADKNAAPGIVPAATPPAPKPPAGASTSAQAEPPASGGTAQAGTNEQYPAPQAPGAVEVDERAAERALERTLVAGGALLLPFGQAEISPSFNYTRRDTKNPTLVNFGTTAAPDFASVDQDVKRNELTAELGLQVGLPLDSQLELSMPYNFAQEERILNTGVSRTTQDGSGSAFGDFSVGLAKTVFREGTWNPDLIARATYDTGSGQKENNGVALNAGFSSITGSLVALKRQDPLAFVVSGFYERVFEDNGVKPGDQYGFTLGTLLASSPETTLRFQLQTTFANDIKIQNQVINDSDQVQGLLIVGASSILGRGVLLDVSGGIGLTSDAPDYFINIALPILFDTPWM
jgi:hypothetical protein